MLSISSHVSADNISNQSTLNSNFDSENIEDQSVTVAENRESDQLVLIEVKAEPPCECDDLDLDKFSVENNEPSSLIKNSGVMASNSEMCDIKNVNFTNKELSRILDHYIENADDGDHLFSFEVCAIFENKNQNVNIYTILWNNPNNRIFYYLLLSNKAPYHAIVTIKETGHALFISKYPRKYSLHALENSDWKKMLDMTINNENYF